MFFLILGVELLFLVALMSVTWYVSYRIHNAGIVDVVWAASFTPVVWICIAMSSGFLTRKLIFGLLVTLWSLRLAQYLFVRVKSHHPTEDGRYAALRTRWGTKAEWNMFTFFQFQGLLILILTIPYLLICQNPISSFSPIEYLGLVIWFIALTGETLADYQLKQFKANPLNKGKVCQIGLWRYSRHPNYFFEWLIWVSFACFTSVLPWGWTYAWYPAALMLYFLLRVTGIPATEKQALETKGEAYAAYQRSTPSAFVPWFPRSS